MKLKYQLRGLGIGMIVTAILMGVTTGRAVPLTDAEIKARALELGMVDGNSLKLTDVGGAATPTPPPEEDMSQSGHEPGDPSGPDQDGNESADPSGPDQDGNESADPSGPDQDGNESADPSGPDQDMNGNASSSGPDTTEIGDSRDSEESGASGSGQGNSSAHGTGDEETAVIVIEPGTDSYAISKMLAEAGLVADAGEFDRFLCDNLYSRKIVDGTYEIPAGAGEEEIAKIITRGR